MESQPKKTSAERSGVESETLKDEQLSEVAGGQSSSDGVNNNHLSDIGNRTIARTDNGTEPGEANGEVPLNAG